MSSDVNTALGECERQAKQLVDEIAKYRSAAVISEQAALSLNALCASLEETQRKIEPLMRQRMDRIVLGLAVGVGLNTALLAAVIVMLVIR